MNGSNREMLNEVSSRPTMFCPHCEQYLTKSTFYHHRREFYNPITKTWDKQKREQKAFMPRRDETTTIDDIEMEQVDDMHVIPDYPEGDSSSSLLAGPQGRDLLNDSGIHSILCRSIVVHKN